MASTDFQQYRLVRQKEYTEHSLKKNFYRDFSQTDVDIIADLQDVMKGLYIQIPPFVIKKMMERGLIPEELPIFDDQENIVKDNLNMLNDIPEYVFVRNILNVAMPFEFSNEGVANPFSPYRMVWAAELADYTYFVKTSLPPKDGIVRVIDVWRKQGSIPLHPLASQNQYFERGEDWDVYDIVDKMLTDLGENSE